MDITRFYVVRVGEQIILLRLEGCKILRKMIHLLIFIVLCNIYVCNYLWTNVHSCKYHVYN